MECCHVFEQMMLYQNLIQLFVQFQQNLQRDPGRREKCIFISWLFLGGTIEWEPKAEQE